MGYCAKVNGKKKSQFNQFEIQAITQQNVKGSEYVMKALCVCVCDNAGLIRRVSFD